MREVDDAHDAEDQRESDAEEEQQRCLRKRIQALRDQEREEVHVAAVRRTACGQAVEGHLAAGRRDLIGREGRDQFGDRRLEALLVHHLHHVALLHPLMVARAHRHLALDAGDRQTFQRRPQLVGIDAASLLDAGRQNLAGLPLLAFEHVRHDAVFLLPECHELLVRRIVEGEAVARGTDQAERRVADRMDAVQIDDRGEQLHLAKAVGIRATVTGTRCCRRPASR